MTALRSLVQEGGDVLLEQYMDCRWTLPAKFTRAERLPRFKHCLYVDRKCLDTLAKMPENFCDEPERRGLESNVVVVVIDGAFGERAPGPDQGLHPDVEGCTEWYVGWRYEEIDLVNSTYLDSHQWPLSHQAYRRPPLIAPFGHNSMPT